MTNFSIRPLTPDLWPALEELFGPAGACGGSWCTSWRIGSVRRKAPRKTNMAAFKTIAAHVPHRSIMRHDVKRLRSTTRKMAS